jgi:3-hydroxybutyrate dehydrogenase
VLETARTGITCNAICPGWVLTPLVQKQIDALAASEKLAPEEAKVKLLGENQPSLEFATPEQPTVDPHRAQQSCASSNFLLR